MAGRRKRVRPQVESEVLVESRRRCALCFGLEQDSRRKSGQIAHVDRDSRNDAKQNLAYLCLEHHNEYDSIQSQGKSFTPAELAQYRAELLTAVKAGTLQVTGTVRSRTRRVATKASARHIDLALYDRRILVYRACRDFLYSIIQKADVDRDELFSLMRETDEAMFLFDENIHNHVLALYLKGVELRHESFKAQRRPDGSDPDVAWEKFEATLESLQFEAERLRTVFKPYFHV